MRKKKGKIVLAGLAIVVPIVYVIAQAQGEPPVRDAIGWVGVVARRWFWAMRQS